MFERMPVRSLVSLVLGGALAAAFGPTDAEAAPDPSVKEAMRKMQAAVQASDLKALPPLFDLTKRKGKPGFERWEVISDRGRSASERGDLGGVKATCTECHDLYRAEYKAKFGSRAP